MSPKRHGPGLVNSVILPIVLATMLAATRKPNIVGDYKHPLYLTAIGVTIVIVMSLASLSNISGFITKFIG